MNGNLGAYYVKKVIPAPFASFFAANISDDLTVRGQYSSHQLYKLTQYRYRVCVSHSYDGLNLLHRH